MFLAVVRDFACFRVFSFFVLLRIFAEFLRKFARKVHEEPHAVGVRFFFYTIAKVFRRFQVARDSFSLEKPRKLRSRFSKFRIFAFIVLLRLERDHKDRGGPEAGNLQPQFKNSENFVFIFQIRKQQETRKIWIFPSIW